MSRLPIIRTVGAFAHPGGRYSNINKLTGHKHQAMADPIVQWGEIASQIMHEIRRFSECLMS